MTINCVSFVSLCRYSAYLSTFESSSAASISSSRQNGDGFKLCIANSNAIAVSAFSPPESCIIFWSFFPGGCAIIFIPAVRISSSSISSSVPRPPPNSSLNTLSKRLLISANCSSNCFRISLSRFSIISSKTFAASIRSSCCVVRSSYLSDTSLYCSMAFTFTEPNDFICFFISAILAFIPETVSSVCVLSASAL